MPLLRNHSGIIVEVQDKKDLYEALLRGLKIIDDDGNDEIQVLLKVKEPFNRKDKKKELELGVMNA